MKILPNDCILIGDNLSVYTSSHFALLADRIPLRRNGNIFFTWNSQLRRNGNKPFEHQKYIIEKEKMKLEI